MSNVKFRVVESFYSIQGEGSSPSHQMLGTGTPSYFIRFFGCNLNCRGFGMPRGQFSTETDEIFASTDLSKIKSIKELPLAKTGCDSYVAIDKRFRDLSPEIDGDELRERIIRDCFPEGAPREGVSLVFTGGEPLLKPMQAKLLAWFEENLDFLIDYHLTNITFETNGTQVLTEEFANWIRNAFKYKFNIMFSVSPKLSSSGVERSKAIKPEVVLQYKQIEEESKCFTHNISMYLKFVVSSEEDVQEALALCKDEFNCVERPQILFMPCGGTYKEYETCARRIADLCMKYHIKMSDRLHIRLFKNAWAT